MQLAGAGDDVLGLLGLIGVPAESRARLDLEDDRRRCVRPMSAVGNKRSLPANCVVAFAVDVRSRQVERWDWIHAFPPIRADSAKPAQ